MRKIAIALMGDSDIYEIDLKLNTHEPNFGAMSADVHSLCFDKSTYFYLSNEYRNIYKHKRKISNYNDDMSDSNLGPDFHIHPIYTHHTWIRKVRIRYKAPRHRLFFSAHHSDTSVQIFYLDERDNCVLYHTIEGEKLLFPDPCHSGQEIHWSTWGGDFAFDDSGNMYISTGQFNPSGIYKISGAGPEEVTGNIQRLAHFSDVTTSLVYAGSNQLLYVQGEQKIFKFDLNTLESTLVYDAASFTTKSIRDITWLNLQLKIPIMK